MKKVQLNEKLGTINQDKIKVCPQLFHQYKASSVPILYATFYILCIKKIFMKKGDRPCMKI